MDQDEEGSSPTVLGPYPISLPEPRRLEGFSDGAFAIIITLLVLEIHRPQSTSGHLARELLNAWPSYVAYLVAFIYVGVIWLNHHYVFDRLRRIDFATNVLNLGIIGTAALIPFPTGVMADAFREGNLQDQRAAVVLYAAMGSLMSAAWLPLLWHLFRHRELAKPEMPQAALVEEIPRPVVGIAMYIVAALVGWFGDPRTAAVMFMLVVAYYAWSGFVIFRVGRRRPAIGAAQRR